MSDLQPEYFNQKWYEYTGLENMSGPAASNPMWEVCHEVSEHALHKWMCTTNFDRATFRLSKMPGNTHSQWKSPLRYSFDVEGTMVYTGGCWDEYVHKFPALVDLTITGTSF